MSDATKAMQQIDGLEIANQKISVKIAALSAAETAAAAVAAAVDLDDDEGATPLDPLPSLRSNQCMHVECDSALKADGDLSSESQAVAFLCRILLCPHDDASIMAVGQSLLSSAADCALAATALRYHNCRTAYHSCTCSLYLTSVQSTDAVLPRKPNQSAQLHIQI